MMKADVLIRPHRWIANLMVELGATLRHEIERVQSCWVHVFAAARGMSVGRLMGPSPVLARTTPARSDRLRWWVIGVSTFLLIGVSGAAARADRSLPTGPAERMDHVEDLGPEASSRVVYHLVHSDARVTSYDNTAHRQSRKKESLNNAIFKDVAADLRFIIFDDVKVFEQLSPAMMQRLRSEFESHRWVIGLRGSSRALKDALSLLDPDLAEADATTGGDDLWVLVKRHPGGFLSELTVAAANKHHPEALETAFRLMRDWHNRNEQPLDAQPLGAQPLSAQKVSDEDDPWSAIHLFEWSGTTLATFAGTPDESAGTYKFTLQIFNLASDQNGYDWYRLDFQTISLGR